MRTTLLFALSIFVLPGCARYEFDLVSPSDLARHIGGGADEVARLDPLEYRLRAVENRIVMQVFNPTPDPITLAGDRSYVVAPNGQSHPLRTQTIAPQTFVKMILPPMRPGYYDSGPTMGFGIGFGISSRMRYGGYPLHDPYFDQPRYVTYYDESDTTYWTWDGEADAKLHLVYLRGTTTFSHDFTFHRKKM